MSDSITVSPQVTDDEEVDATPVVEVKPRPRRRGALSNLQPGNKPPRKRAIRPKDIAEVEKMNLALKMRKEGRTMVEIGEKLGYHDQSGASKLIKRALELLIQESSEEVRKMELERYDEVLLGLAPKYKEGDVRAAEVFVKLAERRSKLLGLDAPERKEVAVDTNIRNVTLNLDAVGDIGTRKALHELLKRRPAELTQG